MDIASTTSWKNRLLSFKFFFFTVLLLILGIVIVVGVIGKIREIKLIREDQVLPVFEEQEEAFEPLSLGQHFVVGYYDVEDVKKLISEGLVGGVFVTRRNVEGKTVEEVREELDSLQEAADENGFLPLFIAADQEGGMVQKLSPPLAKLPPISSVIEKKGVKEYAASQAAELVDIGINVNLAPVVDLSPEKSYPGDRFTKISKRAISSDSEIVSQVASLYCQTLSEHRIIPTLKHFPGLRLASGDTHLKPVVFDVSVNELKENDWIPFRTVLENCDAFVMLSHVILTDLDPERPVSTSEKAIGVIRKDWGNRETIIITDDLSMGAIYTDEAALGEAAVAVLNAGVDLLLIAGDPKVFPATLTAVEEASKSRELDWEVIKQSQKRLQKARSAL